MREMLAAAGGAIPPNSAKVRLSSEMSILLQQLGFNKEEITTIIDSGYTKDQLKSVEDKQGRKDLINKILDLVGITDDSKRERISEDYSNFTFN